MEILASRGILRKKKKSVQEGGGKDQCDATVIYEDLEEFASKKKSRKRD